MLIKEKSSHRTQELNRIAKILFFFYFFFEWPQGILIPPGCVCQIRVAIMLALFLFYGIRKVMTKWLILLGESEVLSSKTLEDRL